MSRRPPRFAEHLLAHLLGSEPSTAFVVGDLREEFCDRVRTVGFRRAQLWYWMQALRIALRVRVERRRDRGTGRFGVSWLTGEIMRVELRQAARFLLHRPAFSGAIVLTVALAIAALTVAFAVVDAVLLEPLPYPKPDQLVVVWEHNIPRTRERNVVSPPNYLRWRESAKSFVEMGALAQSSATLIGREGPERIGIGVATASLFRVLGATPLIGRFYTDAEDTEGAAPVVVLAEGYWRSRFAGSASIIGQSLFVNGEARTVVGVLPQRYEFEPAFSFSGTGTIDMWLPTRFGASDHQMGGRYLQVLARLGAGTTVSGAQSEMSALAGQLRQEFPNRQAGWDVNVVALQPDIVGDAQTLLLVILGAVAFVLLIACANVANLLMTRATARQPELAVRSALGAGRGRLVRQLLLECLLLAAVGGIAGVALARFALHALIAGATAIPRVEAIALDGSVVGFALLATFATVLLFGLAPALHMAGADVAGWLKDRGALGGRRAARRLRAGLAVAQVALSLVLLIGAGVLIRSLANRFAQGVGFDTSSTLAATVELSDDRYEDAGSQARFFEQLVDRVRALPGVSAASAVTFAPLSGTGSATNFWVLDRPIPPDGSLPVADIRWIHRDYFRTLGIPLVSGRSFAESDRENTPLRVVISEAGARTLWPNESAIGKRIAMPWGDTLMAEVIGVARDVRHNGPDEEPRTMIYWEHRQFRWFGNMTLLLRTTGDPTNLVSPVRGVLREMDPALPLFNVRTMSDLFSDVLARSRFATVALGLFALLALILAAIGIYGVIAYATQQRTREIGIRMALGADRTTVIALVLRQGIALVGLALVIGALAALGLSRFLEGLVYEVDPADPLTFLAMGILLGLVGFMATWLPARRASGIAPVDAMRRE